MAKIYIVRDVLTGRIAKAFRSEQKADGYKEFLDPSIQRPTHAVDEVELDEERPIAEVEKAYAAYKRRKAHPPKQIDNASLYAGSPMYFYCRHCEHESDCLPEGYLGSPRRACNECQKLLDAGVILD